MKKIGLIGGLSPESTIYYYRKFVEISRELFDPGYYPELIIYSLNFMKFSENPGGWEGRKEMLVMAAKSLVMAGAQVLGITANTPHIVFPQIVKEVEGEWVSIIDSVVKEAKKKGLGSLLLLGTKTTMTMSFYREQLQDSGFEVFVPGDEDIERIDTIIKNELMFENLRSKEYFIELINSYNVDGVILGCTEIPLLIKEGDVFPHVLDTAEIHIKEIIERVAGGSKEY